MAEKDYCECGLKKKNFMHNCSGQSDYNEIYGCPVCDDKCGFCPEDENAKNNIG